MTKQEAIKEARIGALIEGGTFYVVRRGDEYKAVAEFHYTKRMGRVAEMFDAEKVRRTVPPEVQQ